MKSFAVFNWLMLFALFAPLSAAVTLASLPAAGQPTPVDRATLKQGEALAKQHCVSCHAFAPPDVLPRASWQAAIEKMFLLAEKQAMPGWGEPRPRVTLSEDYRKILAYYEARAPIELAPPDPWPAPSGSSRQFLRHSIGFDEALTQEPAVSSVLLTDLDGDGRLEALITDMRQGVILLAAPYAPELGVTPIARIPHPARITPVDLDRDGRQDFLVADLGEFLPGDHENGAVVWLRGMPEGGYTTFAIKGFPRVADVQAADFDGDGKLDLLVAAFGWNQKGEIALLLNRTEDWTRPSFERKTIDARPGAIHVVPADLNRDGNMDFVALIAQEHEAVVAYLGDGAGGFEMKRLYAAPHPNWGSTGIQLVDLDGDGDLDILVTNGDMFDDDILKPYHGIQWLENRGGLKFTAHRLAGLAGAHRALAVDLDGDGDLDIVAAAFVSGAARPEAATLPSLVWLEQTRRGRFQKHTLEVGNARHATLDVGDVNGNGRPDIVTGTFLLGGRSDRWMEVWIQQLPASSFRLPAASSWPLLEAGSWKLEAGRWQLAAGSCLIPPL